MNDSSVEQPAAARDPWTFVTRVVIVALCVAALYLASDVLIPIAVAVLLSFLLAPVVRQLEAWRVPHILSVLASVAVAIAAFLLIMTLVGRQFVSLSEELPKYEQTFQKRIAFVRDHAPKGLVRTVEVLQGIGDETSLSPEASPEKPGEDAGDEEEEEVAIPVKLERRESTVLELVKRYVTPAIGTLVRIGMVLILVIFILLYRGDLRDRLLRLTGRGSARLTDEAVNEAAERVSGYLMMQFVNNVCYGVAVGVGLWLIGLPGAVMWGLAAMLVRFIPYLGPWVGALLPILLSLGVFNDWTHPLLVVGMFIMLEILFNNFIEPHLFGAGAGISPIAVIVALIFWGWVWGAVGLLVAVPLTACLVVAGRYIPQLEMLTIMLSDQPDGDLPQDIIVTQTSSVARSEA